MPKKRISIPNVIKFELFYRCAKTCCVCQTNRVHHIHHIDKNPENNKIENLIGLCSNCHDEAHTKHELSRNLTQEQLLDLKTRWEAKVSNNSTKIMLPKNKTINNAAWTFINYDRIPYFLENYNIRFDRSRFNNLLASNAIDRDGIPQRLTKPKTIPYRTVYDYLPYELRHSLHHMYSDTINKLINKTKPINIEGTWSRSAIKALTPPGTICFLLRGFYFKKISTDNYTEERIAYRTERKIRLQFFINTRYMFGNSALFDSFTGHRTVAALFQIKSIERENDIFTIHGTSLALGAGFTHLTENPYKHDTLFSQQPPEDELEAFDFTF